MFMLQLILVIMNIVFPLRYLHFYVCSLTLLTHLYIVNCLLPQSRVPVNVAFKKVPYRKNIRIHPHNHNYNYT